MIENRDGPTPPRTAQTPEESVVTPEEFWELLADSLRRRTLRVLDPDEGPVALSDLAARVADETRVDTATLQLHHNHLPKLAEAGVVSYDADENVVEAERLPEWADQYLEL